MSPCQRGFLSEDRPWSLVSACSEILIVSRNGVMSYSHQYMPLDRLNSVNGLGVVLDIKL